MNRLFLFMTILVLGVPVYAQSEKRIDTKEKQENVNSRELKKQLAAIQDSINYKNAVSALEKSNFVLEADQLLFKRGGTAFVSSNTNFVSLSDNRAIVQVAPFNGGGPNGVGGITRTAAETFPSSSSVFPITIQSNVAVKSYKLDFGAQYTHQFGKKHVATLGVVFSPGHDLSNDAYEVTQTGNSNTGATSVTRDTVVTCGIPTTFGAGVTYVYDNRLTVGADVMFQNWSKVSYMNNDEAFCDRGRISVGAEYLPNPMGRSYLSHVKYRLGAYYSKPYYKIDGVRAADEYGVTAGFGLPIPRTRSVLSLSAQYVRTKGTQAAFLNENTLRICIGVTFNERWFFKRKVD